MGFVETQLPPFETDKMPAKKVRQKRIPHRTCIGCRTVIPKRSLIRIVRSQDGVQIDFTGKKAGRGAYLHNKRSCWEIGLKGSLARALKTSLDEGEIAQLKEFCNGIPDGEDD